MVAVTSICCAFFLMNMVLMLYKDFPYAFAAVNFASSIFLGLVVIEFVERPRTESREFLSGAKMEDYCRLVAIFMVPSFVLAFLLLKLDQATFVDGKYRNSTSIYSLIRDWTRAP